MMNASNLYPTLWWDSHAVHEIRIRVQKPLQKEELWAWLFIRRISIYPSLALTSAHIAPNLITLAAIVLSCVTVAASLAGKCSLLLASIAYNVIYLLDCADGEVARLTERTSDTGKMLDRVLGAVIAGMVVAAIYKVDARTLPLILVVSLAGVSLSGLTMPDRLTKMRKSSLLIDIASFPFTSPCLLSVIPFLPLGIGQAYVWVYACAEAAKALMRVASLFKAGA